MKLLKGITPGGFAVDKEIYIKPLIIYKATRAIYL